jgi:hypothetical protein
VKIKKFKKSYDRSIDYQLSMYVVSDSFRCVEFIARDCCWQCETFTLRYVFPPRSGHINVNDFRDFCRSQRPRDERAAMDYANSFEVLSARPTPQVVEEKIKWLAGGE